LAWFGCIGLAAGAWRVANRGEWLGVAQPCRYSIMIGNVKISLAAGTARGLQRSAVPGAWPWWADPQSITRPGAGISSLKHDHELPRAAVHRGPSQFTRYARGVWAAERMPVNPDERAPLKLSIRGGQGHRHPARGRPAADGHRLWDLRRAQETASCAALSVAWAVPPRAGWS